MNGGGLKGCLANHAFAAFMRNPERRAKAKLREFSSEKSPSFSPLLVGGVVEPAGLQRPENTRLKLAGIDGTLDVGVGVE
jgi:hypothetical protein